MCNAVAMPNINETARSWQSDLAKRFGEAVASHRKIRNLTAAELAERTKEFGLPVHRVAISKIETNSRAGKVDLSEVVVLALALGVPPIELLYPALPGGKVEVWPGAETTSIEATQWFSGHITAWMVDQTSFTERSTNVRVQKARQYFNAQQAVSRANLLSIEARVTPDSVSVTADEADRQREVARKNLAEVTKEIREAGWPLDSM